MKNRVLLTAGAFFAVIVAVVSVVTMKQQPETGLEAGVTVPLVSFQNGEDIFISAEDLKSKLGSDNIVILDGNHPKNYRKGHIRGAINIGFKGLSRSEGKPGDLLWGTILDKEQLTRKLESFGVTNDSLIVAYSDTFKGPGAGGRAVWQLRMAGLKNVKLLYGGLEMWRIHGFEITDEKPEPTPSTGLLLSDYREDDRATLEYVKETLGKTVLIDVRSLKEATGEDTSRGEHRGGRIAGAKWLEWTMLLNSNSTPKSSEKIKELLAGVGVKPEDDFVVY